jgi:HK97 family phage major capsid protein
MTDKNMEQMVEERLSVLSASIDKLMAEREGAQGQDKEWRDKTDETLRSFAVKVEELNAALVEAKKRRIAGLEVGTHGEPEKFSVARAIQIAVADAYPSKYAGISKGRNPMQDKEWGLEIEAMRQYATQTGASNQSGGWAIPQQVMADSIIPALRAEAVTGQLGVTIMSGLVGEVTWPTNEGGQEAYFTDFETFQTPAASSTNFGARKSTPKMLASRTRLSWSMLTQTAGVIEAVVRQEIVGAITRRMDRAAFNGAGTENQVRGLYTTPGTNSVDFTGVVYQHSDAFTPDTTVRGLLDDMHWKILGSYFNPGSTAYVGQVNVGATIARRSKDANGRPMFTDPNGQQGGLPNILGRRAVWADIIGNATPATSGARLNYGDWSQMHLHFWEGLQVRAEELSYGADDHDAIARSLTVFGTMFADVFIREPKAFTLATNFTADSL